MFTFTINRMTVEIVVVRLVNYGLAGLVKMNIGDAITNVVVGKIFHSKKKPGTTWTKIEARFDIKPSQMKSLLSQIEDAYQNTELVYTKDAAGVKNTKAGL